ncbi:molecular chaperone GrpE [Meinhardsimonia xiamenensis]|jgi:molecular chaperone GrpE|uniref:Protein GrpE n=1 Tax=Meinhardsimonia xiamenensis TaxID=990712 RepID=A0A1G8Y659_9RHOB|nr:nucleotide exchange factor GrpE [Meinhardsimonia xiamenensis]PRX37181.1 molecular chaperone GrpE [Meinhardsimonia xiamenensis]SDJ98318.1 molecular chaperone GrpE [Meinhardsimonia xiamenensis]
MNDEERSQQAAMAAAMAAAEAAAEAEAQSGEGQDEAADPVAALQAERDELRDRLMRALAETENLRKRAERERREAEQYGGAKLSRDLLPVYDSLWRALETVSEEQRKAASALIEGVELTMRELLNVFARHGIERIVPEIGEKFDPNAHQAMFEAPVPQTKAGDIIEVMQHGFKMHDRLLRPAQVGVSSTPKDQSEG